MGEKVTVIDDDRLSVSEFKYEHDNGVSVRYRPSSKDVRGYEFVGFAWPAEWQDSLMGGENISDDELSDRKTTALKDAKAVVKEVFGDE